MVKTLIEIAVENLIADIQLVHECSKEVADNVAATLIMEPRLLLELKAAADAKRKLKAQVDGTTV